MSKAAKQSILILGVLLLGSLGFAGVTLLGKQKVEQQVAALERELQESQGREKNGLVEIKTLKDQVAKGEGEKSKVQKTVAETQKRIEDLLAQVSDVTGDRDKWKERLDHIKKERDQLLVKLQQKPEPQIVYKYIEKEPVPEPVVSPVQPSIEPKAVEPEKTQPSPPQPEQNFEEVTAQPQAPSRVDEEYWAQLLKEKASLEVKINELKGKLSQNSIEIVELKQSNEALKLELDSIKHEKEEIEGEIQQKEDLINNLSLELARTKNDKKFVADKVAKLNQQNTQLRQQVKQLSSSKSALEKSIVRLTQDKDEVQKKLGQAESIVQSKIDEIWEIKDSLDQSFKTAKMTSTPGEVELPPIVVSTDGFSKGSSPAASHRRVDGKVVSVNEENNFVIVDAGEKQGVRLGDFLDVYRGDEHIGRLEVIQVRPDISAADLKDQWSKVKAGDIIR